MLDSSLNLGVSKYQRDLSMFTGISYSAASSLKISISWEGGHCLKAILICQCSCQGSPVCFGQKRWPCDLLQVIFAIFVNETITMAWWLRGYLTAWNGMDEILDGNSRWIWMYFYLLGWRNQFKNWLREWLFSWCLCLQLSFHELQSIANVVDGNDHIIYIHIQWLFWSMLLFLALCCFKFQFCRSVNCITYI